MISHIGCGLSISKLAEILDRMQKSDQYSNLKFQVRGGRKGYVLVENGPTNPSLRLEKSIYDIWPFIPDNNLDQLYKDTTVCRRWGLDIDCLQSFTIRDITQETSNMMSILQHIKNFAYFSSWKSGMSDIITEMSIKVWQSCDLTFPTSQYIIKSLQPIWALLKMRVKCWNGEWTYANYASTNWSRHRLGRQNHSNHKARQSQNVSNILGFKTQMNAKIVGLQKEIEKTTDEQTRLRK